MLASDSIHFWIASSMLTFAHVSSSAAAAASRNGVLDGSWKLLLTAATASTSTVAAARAKNSGHIRHTTGAWCSSTKSSPNATPDPTVSQATLLVNLCVRTSSSSGDSRLTRITANIANTTPTDAVLPGRSPSATPTATGTAALSTAANGEITEIGPVLTAAKNAHMPNAMPMPYRPPHTTAPGVIVPPTAMASAPSNTASIG